jgi:pimeloyl-ACP methyl ester carboxylesterase
VLLIHGAPQTGHAWRKVVPTLVAAGYQVVVPDYRGAGASSKPRDGYDKWTMAGDLHDLVRNELNIDGPISIVGHDLGSMVAFAYALRYRDDVGSLTTMEAPLPGTDYYEQRKVAKSAWHFDFHANPDIAAYLTHGRERWYITRFFDDLTYQPDAISQDDLDVYARAFEAPGAMRALCEIYRELDHDAEIHRANIAANGKLPVPVLASGGGAQTLAANYAPMCEEVALDVTGHLVPDAGHWVAEENPDYFLSHVHRVRRLSQNCTAESAQTSDTRLRRIGSRLGESNPDLRIRSGSRSRWWPMIGAVQTVLRGPRLATGSDGRCWEYGDTSGA